jgi:phosphohistidine phosphatase SixA
MKKLVLVRHGEYSTIDGQYILNEEGRQQIAVLAPKLRALIGDQRVALHTSWAARAAASAAILADALGVTFEEHRELWSGGDGIGHYPDTEAMVWQIVEWAEEYDVLILVTHLEFVERLPNKFANVVFKTAIREVHIPKGHAGVIDCDTKLMSQVS